MKMNDVRCEHACRETCAMLKRALRQEEDLIAFYQGVRSECDYPEVHALLDDLVKVHQDVSDRISGQLSAMHARGETLDGVMASFDPAGC